MGRGGKSPSPQKVLSHCVDRVTASPRCSPIASFSRIGTKDPPQWFVTTPAPRKMHGPRLLCLLSLVFLLRGAFPEAVSRALSSTGIPEFALLPRWLFVQCRRRACDAKGHTSDVTLEEGQVGNSRRGACVLSCVNFQQLSAA